jgi:hypothetical protein
MPESRISVEVAVCTANAVPSTVLAMSRTAAGTFPEETELPWRAGVPCRKCGARVIDKREDDVVAGGVSLKKRRSQQAGNFWLRRRLNTGRTNRQIHLRKTSRATTRDPTFSTQTDENCLCAGRRYSRRSRACEPRNATHDRCAARPSVRIKSINALRAEIGHQELRTVRRHGQSPQTCVG